MRFLICTLSGTGNTLLTAGFIASALKESGASVIEYDIEAYIQRGEIPDIPSCDHLLIGYPIHAFNTPEHVVGFVSSLPQSKEKPVSFFKTSGEPFRYNNSSSHLVSKILETKGYVSMAEHHFLMPYNVMFRYPDALAKQMYLKMQDDAAAFAIALLDGRDTIIRSTWFQRGFSAFLRAIQWGGARLNGRMYSCRHGKCIKCMKCVKRCPTRNILMKDGKIRFDGRCMMCMRCVQNCPVEAINIGLLRFWAVRGIYDFRKLAEDDSIPSVYVDKNTKGYFRLFRSFFENQDT